MPKTVAIIPARYASTRLPGKLIKNEAKEQTGKYLIEHVYRKAKEAKKINEVIIATDDERIAEVVKEFGGCVKMTSTDHTSGTDRIAEAAANLDVDFVVNIQGDEPDIKGSMIDDLIDAMYSEKIASVCTFANKIKTIEEFVDPNAVKVVIDKDSYAMYFSRASIPYVRDQENNSMFSMSDNTANEIDTEKDTPFLFLKHLGIYMYRKDFLLAFSSLPVPDVEKLEKLEQLRVLSNGYKIKVIPTSCTCEGVDTPEDFAKFLKRYRFDGQKN
jgi:3-deoxy-manno-octulosonate cytidylyltransferase (CMP-KDO synthetase)